VGFQAPSPKPADHPRCWRPTCLVIVRESQSLLKLSGYRPRWSVLHVAASARPGGAGESGMVRRSSKLTLFNPALKAVGRIEWPTVVLGVVIYAAWMGATLEHRSLGLPLLFVFGGWITAWHGSLQHEVIHGHPTPWRRVNTLFAAAPLSLWLPFDIYRRTHIAHHATEDLTNPHQDPESRYLAAGEGLGFQVRRVLARLQAPLLGRLIIGPWVEIGAHLMVEARALIRDEAGARSAWARHLLAAAPLLLWLHFVCRLSLLRYGLCFIYPGAALSLLRSFAEHRADPIPGRRVAVVERAPLLGLLFLNNNLHAAHHAWPAAAWFDLRPRYAAHRERLLEANGGLIYDGYGDVLRRFLFRAHDRIDHVPAPAPAECLQP
jgi:fatty acid desaturase